MSTNHQLFDDSSYQQFLRWESASEDSVLLRRIYCDVAGDLPGGLLLSQLIYWFLLGQNGQPRVRVFKRGRFWVAKRRQDWYAECRISSRQFDRAVRKLKKQGVVTTLLAKFRGTPVLHLSANWDVLIAQIATLESKNIEISRSEKSSEPNESYSYCTGGQVDCAQQNKSLTENTSESTPKNKDRSMLSSTLSKETGENKQSHSENAPQVSPSVAEGSEQAVPQSLPRKFVAPTIQELTDHIRSLGCVDAENKAEEFYRKYESQKWLIRGTTMRSWRKVVEAWKRNWDSSSKQIPTPPPNTENTGHERLLEMVARSKQLKKRL